MRTVLALSVVGFAIATLAAQTPQFRATANLVQLDVVVTDKDHHPVRGLTAADFTVLEHGRPQPIVTFSPVTLPDAVTPSAVWMRTATTDVTTNTLDTRRVIVIVMDDPNMPFSPGVTKLARQVAYAIIDRLGPHDLAAVVYTYLGRNQNFTTDKHALKDAVDALRPHPGAVACYFKDNGCDTGTLISAGRLLREAPAGRKLIMFISAGRAFVYSDLLGDQQSDRLAALQELLQVLQESNTAIYAFDPNGLSTGAGLAEHAGTKVDFSAGRLARVNETLHMFAEGTGGRAITDNNTPWEDVPGVLAENSSYYLLGFRPDDPSEDGRYRRIVVKVNRPGVEVRARGGYFLPKPAGSPKPADTPPTPLETTMARGLPTGEARLQVAVAPFAGTTRELADVVATVAVLLPIDADPTAGAVTRPLEVAVTAYDLDWRPQGTFRQRAELTVRPGTVMQLSTPYEIVARLPLRPGRYELRVGADAAPVTGGVFVDVEVPAFDKAAVSLSGVLVERLTAPAAPPDGLPATPTVARAFASSDSVRAAARVYQGGHGRMAPVVVTATILDAHDQVAFTERTTIAADQFSAAREADYQLHLPLVRLPAGPYALKIEAALGKRTVRRDLVFSVVR